MKIFTPLGEKMIIMKGSKKQEDILCLMMIIDPGFVYDSNSLLCTLPSPLFNQTIKICWMLDNIGTWLTPALQRYAVYWEMASIIIKA